MAMNPPGQPVIRVQGHGEVASTPDIAVLSLTITSAQAKYDTAVKDLNGTMNRLRLELTRIGIDQKLLKTTSFDVSVVNQYVDGRHQFVGFQATHRLELRQPFHQQHLSRVFEGITASKAEPLLGLSFTVSNPEEIREKVLQSAVKNARSRAELIAEAAGQTLGAVVSIEYGYTEVRISSESAELASGVCMDAPMIEPADVESSDTVTITWMISEKPPAAR